MRNLFFAFATLSLVATAATAAQAAASDLDECIVDIMMQCSDDDDFWGCYEVGTELCENQHSSELSAPEISKIKADAKRRADSFYKTQATKK